MRNFIHRSLLIFSAFLLFPAMLSAQDSISNKPQGPQRVQIINSDVMRMIDSVTVLVGNVVLEHNRVVMACDSAEWLSNGIFNSFGNVVVTSASAQVTGDYMEYNGNTNMAKVRGKVVYLKDSTSTLRSTGIDFNTKEEIGFFENEGTIKDTAQLLESMQGYYYSHRKEFEFIGRVQSETNDYLLQSDSMKYNTETKLFTFYSNTHIWAKNRDGYMYCDRGWYDSDEDKLFFLRNSYMMTKSQEVFADSIYYENRSGRGKLYSNVQVVDTAQRTVAMSDFADFDVNTQDFMLRKNPSVMMYDENNDTVFMRADTLLSFNVSLAGAQPEQERSLEQDTQSKSESSRRLQGGKPSEPKDALDLSDNVPARGKGGRIASADANNRLSSHLPKTEPAGDKSQNLKNSVDAGLKQSAGAPTENKSASPPDTTHHKNNADSLTIDLHNDSLKISFSSALAPDSVNTVMSTDSASLTQKNDSIRTDSTYRKIFGIRNVKIFRRDFQAKCDSAYFNTLDSIWKMHKSPVIWDSAKMQILGDSIRMYIKNGSPERAEFENNALIVIPEGKPDDSTAYFNQIKGRNMVARFKNKELKILNVAGNVHTLFFSISDMMMNDTEAASMKILFESRQICHVAYYSDITGGNNPLFLVPFEDTKLTGFVWLDDLRPKSKEEILMRPMRMSVRETKESLSKPEFPITHRINKAAGIE